MRTFAFIPDQETLKNETKGSPFTRPSCQISADGNAVTIEDSTTGEKFAITRNFDQVFDHFQDILMECPEKETNRLISLCSSNSKFTPEQILETCIQFARYYIPPEGEKEFLISSGLVFDKNVIDYFALDNSKVKEFESIPIYHISEAVDLISTALEDRKSFENSLFVFRIECQEFFFEWVIIPNVDQKNSDFVLDLPSNQKIVFYLRKIASIMQNSFDHFRRESSCFRLIADTFVDINTTWVAHLNPYAKLASNAAIFNVLNASTEPLKNKFTCQRSELFAQHKENFDLNDDDSYAAEREYKQQLEDLGAEEVQFDDDNDLSNQTSPTKLSASNQNMRGSSIVVPYGEYTNNGEEEEEDSEEMERMQRLKELRESHMNKNKDKKSRVQRRGEVNHSMAESSSVYSRMSQRSKLAAKLAQIRARNMNIDEEEEEEEEDTNLEDEKDNKNKKKELTPLQLRQKRLEKQRLLIFRCQKALNDENSTTEKLSSLNDELQAELEHCREFRSTIKDEISRVRKELQQKQKKASEQRKIAEKYQQLYLETHNDRIQQKYQNTRPHYKPATVDKNPEYARTIALLQAEVKKLEKEVNELQSHVGN
ncbi:hypothetical protein TVAG_227720 [Trichomonas vaginalis G3]|uniref:Uncharacterized protein n=1 Tax=Trichomonas vaginalis (strain ATCC PRA-98 / G3) TaxID=412133 RepID=A2ERS4_TRIV3|nr:hypothetical protein TVAGG3_0182940 [Trichomonas vaginalis G3]EAY04655.1 hypothetical protein TVAG_227720 [Trichomonas vaginalis G3]KAI5549429.1 hypothetical protein TVAGG3_0182940 [Trichomonas vaginalis G3]|eukprot:XP_001316878.1 hypothetical protein [Trichomonas vaginalis G3]